jgi:hypothetical protein
LNHPHKTSTIGLDLTLGEYAKVLCALLDIPYENPIESLHLMFELFIDFRNNPHFQARIAEGNDVADGKERYERGRGGGDNGGADVMEVNQAEYSEYK